MRARDIKFGDVITYRSGRVNNVNNPDKYHIYFNDNLENKTKPSDWDIMRVQRYVRVLWFYKLRTIYRRYK
jgi:hypothetical protein